MASRGGTESRQPPLRDSSRGLVLGTLQVHNVIERTGGTTHSSSAAPRLLQCFERGRLLLGPARHRVAALWTAKAQTLEEVRGSAVGGVEQRRSDGSEHPGHPPGLGANQGHRQRSTWLSLRLCRTQSRCLEVGFQRLHSQAAERKFDTHQGQSGVCGDPSFPRYCIGMGRGI